MSDNLFDRAFEASPALLWQGDARGACVRLNQAQRAFWGVSPEQVSTFDWSSTLLAEDRLLVQEPFGRGMADQASFTCEARYRRADGAVRLLRTRANPVFDDADVFVGMVGVNEDITDLRETETRLAETNTGLHRSLEDARASTRRFELASRISGLAMSEHDADLRYTWAHGMPESSLGKTPSEVVGGELGALLDDFLASALRSNTPLTQEIEFVIEDRRQWWEVQACRTTTASGLAGVLACALDVTARRLNESKLEVLARELSHRVKNVYSVVQAVIHQTARASGVPQEFVATLSQRLKTLAAAQDGLLKDDRDHVSLLELTRQTLAHVDGVQTEGPDLPIPARIAPYLALALHELGTNSLKYGALLQPEGQVHLRWHLCGEEELCVEWEERTITVPPSPHHKGFGTMLLTRIFAAATGGEADREWREDVLRWRAKVPLRAQIGL